MDKYKNFVELAAVERRGRDYRVRVVEGNNSPWLVMAPHGGSIEPGTSEIAKAVARGIHGCYRFEGVKRRGNGDLHITSTRFDEPRALAMAASADSILAVHGEASGQKVVFIGGRDVLAQNRLTAVLRAGGFVVRRHHNRSLAGAANRGTRGAGVQIELSLGLRRACFSSLSTSGRMITTPTFKRLVAAVRTALQGEV